MFDYCFRFQWTLNENLESPTISLISINKTSVLVGSYFSNLDHATGHSLALKTEHLISTIPPISFTVVCVSILRIG